MSTSVHPLETKPDPNSSSHNLNSLLEFPEIKAAIAARTSLFPGIESPPAHRKKRPPKVSAVEQALDNVEYAGWDELTGFEKSQAYRLPPPTQLELDFRHSFWHADRVKTLDAFQRVNISTSRIDRFSCCGGACHIQIAKDNGEARVVANKCHDRFCKACGQERQRIISRQLIQHCQSKELRFVTLTMKHNTEPLSDQIDRLFKAFTMLRARVFWKTKVSGGVAFFELKPDKDGKTWHPHLHIIVEGEYIPQATLSSEWLSITKDSSVVHVEFVHNKERQLSYVAKYASKPLDGSLYHYPEMLDEAIKALQGRRTCTTFGAWRSLKLDDTTEDTREWIDIGSLDSVRAQAKEGSTFHQQLCVSLNIDRTWAAAENGDSS